MKALVEQISEIQNKYRSEKSLSERAQEIQKEGVRFGMYGGGQTADQWAQAARGSLADGFASAKTAASHFKVEDVLGASRYHEESLVASAKLRQAGTAFLGSGPQTNNGLSDAAGSKVLAQAHMAFANSHAPAGSDPAAYMFMGHSGMPGTARTDATDPYTARVDAERRQVMFSQHTIGIGGALDFNPAARPGWTGAKDVGWGTGGLRGAYGATGPRAEEVLKRKQEQAAAKGATSGDIGKLNQDLVKAIKELLMK